MMVSMITAVLPVCRSPMISSRWPRPIGISASIAFMPVCIGSCTDLRGMMPGAFTSTRRRSVASIGPLPSIGLPSAIDHAAEQAIADRHVDDGAGAADRVAFADLLGRRRRSRCRRCRSRGSAPCPARRRRGTPPARRPSRSAGRRRGRCRRRRDSTWPVSATFGLGVEAGDLLLQDLRDLGGTDLHVRRLPSWRTAGAAAGI